MFDVANAYAEWVASHDAFIGEFDLSPSDAMSRIALEADSILDESVWETVLSSVSAASEGDGDDLGEWLSVIVSGMRTWAHNSQSGNSEYSSSTLREAIEKHLFLSRIVLTRLDAQLDSEDIQNVAPQICALLDADSQILSSGLETLVPVSASAERTSLSLLYLEPALQLLQREAVCQNQRLVNHIIKLVCLAVKLQHLVANVQSHIVQLLCYYEHTPKVLVQLLQVLKEEYNHTALAESVFRELSMRAGEESASAESTPQAKALQKFFQGIVAIMPNVITSQLSATTPLFNSPSPQLRQAAIEMAGAIMQHLMSTEPEPGAEEARLNILTDLLQLIVTRVNDITHFCRMRALQTLATVAGNRILVPRRSVLMAVASEKMKDRAALVRKTAIKLVKVMLESHPFTNFGDQLERSRWTSRLAKTEEMLQSAPPDSEQSSQLEMMIQYHQDALAFMDQVDDALATAKLLLQSKSKSDILDSIDLLVTADAFGVESSKPGIRQMVHLVWAKADNDEGDSVCSAVVTTYHDLFMVASPTLDPRTRAFQVARNLIGLTFHASQGELTSLERLLYLAMDKDMIAPAVINALCQIYQGDRTNRMQRRGCAAILSMLAAYDRNIALTGMGAIQSVGLPAGDLELAKYSCVLARRSVAEGSGVGIGLPVEHSLFAAIVQTLLVPATSLEWFGFAKEALRAMGTLCDSAEVLYTHLIKAMIVETFDFDADVSHSGLDLETGQARQAKFGQLIFVVGEVALNTLVQLETCELEFKRARREAEDKKRPQSAAAPTENDEEEEMIGGGASVEDTFVDAISEIKQRELLFSDKALLRPFARMIPELCRDELQEGRQASPFMAVAATQTLAKFMCVSKAYCAEHLPLLLELMDSHTNSVIRSNLVVALSDIAVTFNHLVDQHTEFLYTRLNDPYPVVQRTCIVALTFLILAGQIKVKGQLVEMAKAVENEDPKIAALATMFFRELATKDNAIYNSFLDILSGLAADASLPEPTMMSLLKFLSQFVEKERQIKQLTEKLVIRLSRCETRRQWNACVQVLKSLPTKTSDEVRALIEKGFTPIPGTAPVDDDPLAPTQPDHESHDDDEDHGDDVRGDDNRGEAVEFVATAMHDLSIVEPSELPVA